jgi:glycosyltransferase involved in cell wall biosynthesis
MRVALCEAAMLTPEHDASSRADTDFLSGVSSLGHAIELFAENQPGTVDNLNSFEPDVVFISRPALFLRLQPQIRGLNKPIGYLAQDLHHIRLELQAGFSGDNPLRAQVMKTVESFCFTRSSLAILPTHSEAIDAREIFPGSCVTWMRYFDMEPELKLPQARAHHQSPSRRDLIFVGSSAHHPNLDGVSWFIHEVLPAVQAEFPDTTLTVVGEWDALQVAALLAPGVRFAGQLPANELSIAMAQAALGISPLRFGAGMKRKTLDYLSRGLPVVSSSYGVQGLSYFDSRRQTREDSTADDFSIPGVMIPTSTSGWVDSVKRLLASPRLREQLGNEGRVFVTNSFSHSKYLEDVQRVLREVTGAVNE